MGLNPQALTTVARFKTFSGIAVNTFDTKIEYIINIVTDYIEHYCDRRFLKTTYTNEVYDGNGWRQLLLKNYPVVSTSAFQLDERDTDLNEANWSSQDTNLYHIDYDAGIVESVGGTRFSEAPRKYQITYTAGYAFKNDAAPLVTLESLGIGDLEYACWVISSNIYDKGGQNTGGVKSESIGNYSVTYGDFYLLDPEVKMILNKYKRPHSM
jgi:hypothetical protein